MSYRDSFLSKVKDPFRCDLCKKSYARIHDLDAHLVSYDHHHNERRRGLRQAHSRTAPSKQASQGKQSDGMLQVLPLVEQPVKKHKTGGFKSAFGSSVPASQGDDAAKPETRSPSPIAHLTQPAEELDVKYDPRYPTTGWD